MNEDILKHENEVFVIAKYRKKDLLYYILFIKLLLKDIFIKTLFLLYPHKKKNKKYNISICSIFKNEASYLKEFIEYYRLLGFDHFYLYNNNSDDGFMEVLKPYIEEGIVTYHEWPQVPGQQAMYIHFCQNYLHETNWVSFLDIDEFICPIKDTNIKDWMKKFERYPQLLIYWKMFGTNGIINHDANKLVIEQYTNCWPKLDTYGKIIYNTDFPIVEHFTGLMHGFKVWYKGFRIPPLNQFGYFVDYDIHRYNNEEIDIQCNHYWSKSYDNYIKKHQRGSAAFGKSWKTFDKFLLHENHNSSCDYSIFRFLIQLKLKMQGIYPENINE